MSLGDYWVSIWDAIVTEVKKVTDLADKTYYGLKEPIEDSPAAYVEPAMITPTPASPTYSTFLIPFDIFIYKEFADLVQGMKDVMNLAGQIYDQLIDDRKLGDLVDNLEVTITPGRRGRRGFERHWVTVTVVCRRVRV